VKIELQKISKVFNRCLKIFSIFVLVGDGILLIILIANNLIAAIAGRYGTPTYDLVVASALGAMIGVAFYFGILFQRRESRHHHKVSRLRSNEL
jgi:uncharacterized membrane protein YccC